MGKRLAIGSLLVGLGLAAGAGCAATGWAGRARAEPATPPDDAWHAFVSERGRFQVALPAEPQIAADRERVTLLGTVTGEVYRVRRRDLELAVEVRDLPALAETLVPADLILSSTRSGVAEDLDAEEVAGRELRLQGQPAHDFVYRIPGERPVLERALVVLVGGRLYLLTGKPEGESGPSPELERFFASFRFWREGETGRDPLPAARADGP